MTVEDADELPAEADPASEEFAPDAIEEPVLPEEAQPDSSAPGNNQGLVAMHQMIINFILMHAKRAS